MIQDKFIRRAGFVVLLAASVAACNSETTKVQETTPTLSLPALRTKPFADVQPRNPKTDGGEVRRTLERDALGRLLSITIDYENHSSVVIRKDESGKISAVETTGKDGTIISGSPDSPGTAIASGRIANAQGDMMVSRAKLADSTQKKFFRPEEKTLALIADLYASGNQARTGFAADGKTPEFEEAYEGATRVSLKIYLQGKLAYAEQRTEPLATFGQIVTYEGTVYDGMEHATHRILLEEGPYDQGGGHVRKIETLASDGKTATSTKSLEFFDPSEVPLGIFATQQELVRRKIAIEMAANAEFQREAPLDSTLTPWLSDRTH